MKWLVTGGWGFIGSNFIRMILNETEDEVCVYDKWTYAANPENLSGLRSLKLAVKGDVIDKQKFRDTVEDFKPDVVIHMAAESHVDRSIEDSGQFVLSNVVGTQVVLDVCLEYGCRLVYVSTDEVYGALSDPSEPAFTEETPLAPNSPYAASKASGDLLVRSYVVTHKMDAVTTHCSNNYGAYQHPEKMIPKCITNALQNKTIPVYGKGLNVRDWLWVQDHCEGIRLAATRGKKGETYNFGGITKSNIDLVRTLLQIMSKPLDLIEYVEDRKGHDFMYEVDSTKARIELDWHPHHTDLVLGLSDTVTWYEEHRKWWNCP